MLCATFYISPKFIKKASTIACDVLSVKSGVLKDPGVINANAEAPTKLSVLLLICLVTGYPIPFTNLILTYSGRGSFKFCLYST